MGVTDLKYSLILLHALPPSYETLAATILAGGSPSKLSHTKITAQIINEKGRQSGGTASLNAARTPVKCTSNSTMASVSVKKQKYADVICHYCKKKGYI